jgi:predicted phosphodiesterase
MHLDTHLKPSEVIRQVFVPGTYDVAIIAGDIASGPKAQKRWLRKLSEQDIPYVYAAGNHDYWGSTRERDATTTDANTAIGVCWYACTSWYAPPNTHEWVDFRRTPWLAKALPEMHRRDTDLLRSLMGKVNIIITHMLPSYACVDPEYEGDPTNRYYVNDFHAELEAGNGPPLWVHGHTHKRMDRVIGRTRVVCNPYGYPGENPRWEPMIVEVE